MGAKEVTEGNITWSNKNWIRVRLQNIKTESDKASPKHSQSKQFAM